MEVQLEINGQKVSVKTGATIMTAVNKLGVYVPHFCYHEKLSIAANCRMCMVDVEKSPKPVPACATPAVDGMVVHTDSERAKHAQQSVMEFLLINHPLDCPICDQGGECQLQDLAVGYGVSRSRYQEEKRVVFEKNLGSLIATDMTRCIHCTRCVRFGREVAGIMELGLVGRGEHAEIMPFVERTVDSELSGNMIDVCPVGALTSKPFRYTARPWELSDKSAVGTHDSWGSHLRVQIKGQQVKRVLPSRAEGIHEHWIADRDRFSYDGLTAADRAAVPMARAGDGTSLKEVPWRDAVESMAQQLNAVSARHGAEQIGLFVSPRATCEEAYLLQRIARHIGCRNIDSRLRRQDFSGDDIVGLGVPMSELKGLKNVLLVGANPARELPLLASHLRQKAARKSYFSISAESIDGSIPLQQQMVLRPQQLASALVQLVLAVGGAAPDGWTDADAVADGEVVEKIAAALQKAPEQSVVWLGDVARGAAQYGIITAMARQLSSLLGLRIGVLDDGANGVGLRRAAALPGVGGMDTAAMLAADLKAVVLFRCEPEDFYAPALLRKKLDAAEYVCAITAFTGGVSDHADMILPAGDFAESDGTYVNGHGEESWFVAAAPPPAKARPAWKILRLLGEYMAVPGIDFSELESIRGGREENVDLQPAVAQPYQSYTPAGLSCYSGAPLYGGDMLVRRAAALQATRHGQALACAWMNPHDMQTHQITENDSVLFSDVGGDDRCEMPVRADSRLPAGVVRLHHDALSVAAELAVQVVRQTLEQSA